MASQVAVVNLASDVFTTQAVQQVRALLNAVRQYYEHTGSYGETERFIDQLQFDRSLIDNIYLLDADGQIVVAHNAGTVGLRASERRYFKHHRIHAGQEAHISPVEPGLVTGKLHFRISMRVDHREGEFAGVVLAAMRPEAFAAYYHQLSAGNSWLFSLIGVDDRLLRARFPEPALDQWTQPARVEGLELPTDQLIGEFSGASSVDGVVRQYSYRKLPGWPLVMIVGYTQQDVDERAAVRIERLQWWLGSGVVVIFLIMVILSLVMVSRQRLELANSRLTNSYRQMREQAMKDALTGLPARPMFFDRMAHALAQAHREGRQLGLLYADLDGFKPVNDRYGHDAGDVVLKVVAQRWLSAVRASDTVARLGGDEFAVIVVDVDDSADLKTVCHKLLAALAEPIRLPSGQSVTVGASIGIAVYPDNGEEIDSLLVAADMAMYDSKARGKNVFSWSNCSSAAGRDKKPWIELSAEQAVGIPEIDVQHQELAGMINQLNRCLQHDADPKDVHKRLGVLQAATRHHFATEHDYMRRYRYPGLEMHDQEHERLLAELGQMIDELKPGGERLFLQILKDWLLGHIEGSDKMLGDFLAEAGVLSDAVNEKSPAEHGRP